MRPPGSPPLRNWQRDPRTVGRDQVFIDQVMRLWGQRLDTAAIAARVKETEAAVTKALHIGREQARQSYSAPAPSLAPATPLPPLDDRPQRASRPDLTSLLMGDPSPTRSALTSKTEERT